MAFEKNRRSICPDFSLPLEDKSEDPDPDSHEEQSNPLPPTYTELNPAPPKHNPLLKSLLDSNFDDPTKNQNVSLPAANPTENEKNSQLEAESVGSQTFNTVYLYDGNYEKKLADWKHRMALSHRSQ